MKPKSVTTPAATSTAPTTESGALTQALLVASMCEKISPKAPKAVMNAESVVGLNGERPGIPVS